MGGIPKDLESIFERIRKEVLWIELNWKIYDQIFNHSALRTEMLNECAPGALSCFQNALGTEVLMSISRLTDERGKDDKQRLSFKKLQEEIGKLGHKDLLGKLRNIRKEIDAKCKKIREHRDRRFAHLDLTVALGDSDNPHHTPAKTINEIITAFHEYIRTCGQHYKPDEPFTYELGSSITQAGEALISVLKKGLRFDELVWERKIRYTELDTGKWKDA